MSTQTGGVFFISDLVVHLWGCNYDSANMKTLAVIPARGGSQRIASKNIKPFLGRPMIEYSIEAARQSQIFDRIIVSTDCDEIAAVAVKAGAEVPFKRSAELADHFTGTQAVTANAIEKLLAAGQDYHYVCCIYATSPLLNPEFLVQGIKLLQENSYDFVVSATAFEFPIQRALYKDGDCYVPINEDTMVKRSQDLPQCWHDAAQFYWGTSKAFLENRNLWGKRTSAVIIPPTHVQDIDTLEDWQMAEVKYRCLYGDKRE
jgi:N-acylneuraminate cytidylyltransferase